MEHMISSVSDNWFKRVALPTEQILILQKNIIKKILGKFLKMGKLIIQDYCQQHKKTEEEIFVQQQLFFLLLQCSVKRSLKRKEMIL